MLLDAEIAEINFRLVDYGWSLQTLSKLARIDNGGLSKILSQKVNPTEAVCARIAIALRAKPSKIFPRIFDPNSVDRFFGTEQVRAVPISERPENALTAAKIAFWKEPDAMSLEQRRLIGQAMGKPCWRIFPDLFDHNDNPIPAVASRV